jgi:hypothetical protein
VSILFCAASPRLTAPPISGGNYFAALSLVIELSGQANTSGGTFKPVWFGANTVPRTSQNVAAEVLEGDFNLPPVVTDGGNLQAVAEVLENVVPGLRDCCDIRD